MPFSLLLTALAEIRDPRRPQGRRYALAPLLLFSVLAVLAGATSYQGIITFIDVHRERLNREFGVCFRRAPALNTLRNLLLALDPADLEAAFRRHARHLDQRISAAGWRTVALDGKTLRGSFDHLHDQPAAHVLSAFASDAALILAHQEVAAAPGEVPAVPKLIAELGLTSVREDIVIRSLGRETPIREVYAATALDSHRTPATQAMLEILQGVAARYESRRPQLQLVG